MDFLSQQAKEIAALMVRANIISSPLEQLRAEALLGVAFSERFGPLLETQDEEDGLDSDNPRPAAKIA